jgi:hypothetical protein
MTSIETQFANLPQSRFVLKSQIPETRFTVNNQETSLNVTVFAAVLGRSSI